jgi:P27 family predicted phage terminase small subunit
MRGRKPKPVHLKLLAGNPGKCPINRRSPVPPGELFEAPDWLSETQRASWAYAIAHSPRGLLRMLDHSALMVWVVAEDLHRQALAEVGKLGLVVETKLGNPIQNPYLPILNRQAAIMLKAASELGFTPSSRSRVTTDNDQGGANPFDEHRRA